MTSFASYNTPIFLSSRTPRLLHYNFPANLFSLHSIPALSFLILSVTSCAPWFFAAPRFPSIFSVASSAPWSFADGISSSMYFVISCAPWSLRRSDIANEFRRR
ncbi:hypothetical protein BDD12DRAFT_851832 [Trichophaea hybrida]|nr:hypothetical protein BDD12DRAFT_851832 [Trichophaea hybrida]